MNYLIIGACIIQLVWFWIDGGLGRVMAEVEIAVCVISAALYWVAKLIDKSAPK